MKVGSKVICVDDTNWHPNVDQYFDKLPVKGCTYIVRRIIEDFVFNRTPGIALHSFYGNWSYWNSASGIRMYEEAHFRMNRFREIEDDQIDQMIDNAFMIKEEVEVLKISNEPEQSNV
jgi:hypothetical protein